MTKRTLFFDKHFANLWSSSLISNFINFCITLISSIYVFKLSQSSLKSGLVFSSNWILPAILFPLSTEIINRIKFNHLLLITTIIKAIIYFFIYLSFKNSLLDYTYILIALTGYLTNIENSVRQIIIKITTQEKELESKISYLSTSVYTGMIMGGLSSSIFTKLSVEEGPFFLAVLSCIIILFINKKLAMPLKEQTTQELKKYSFLNKYINAYEIIKSEGLVLYLLFFTSVVTFFQGYHNIARSAYSIDYLGLKLHGMSDIQIISTSAVIVGSLLFGWIKRTNFELQGSLLFVLTTIFQLVTMATHQKVSGLIFYFTFILFFELSFLFYQGQLIRKSSMENVSMVVISSSSFSQLLLGISILLFGILNESIGIKNLNFTLSILSILTLTILNLIKRNKK